MSLGRLKGAVREAAAAAGVDDRLRALRGYVGPAAARQDRRDARNLRLLLAFLLHEDSNCVDVGAYRGAVLREIVRFAPRGRHVAYEPIPRLNEQLRAAFPDVDVRLAALSDETAESRFQHVKTSPSYSGFRRRDYPGDESVEPIVVRTETLDSALPEGFVPTLIKIDVEGAELQVLRGAVETLARHRPVVVFEHGKGGAPHYGTNPTAVFDLLSEAAGLRVFDLDGNGPYERRLFVETFERGDRWNFVAKP